MYKFNKTYMSNPYYWDFPQRADTMYMSTICKQIIIKKINLGRPEKAQGNRFF